MIYNDFYGYKLPEPNRKKDFPKGILYMALCNTGIGPADPNEWDTARYQDVFSLEVKEIRYVSADTDELPQDPSYFHDEVVEKDELGYEFAVYGWIEAGRGVEKRIIEKATKAYDAWDLG